MNLVRLGLSRPDSRSETTSAIGTDPALLLSDLRRETAARSSTDLELARLELELARRELDARSATDLELARRDLDRARRDLADRAASKLELARRRDLAEGSGLHIAEPADLSRPG